MREGFSRHSTGGPVRMTNQDAPEGTHTTDNTWMHNEISRSTTKSLVIKLGIASDFWGFEGI